MRTELELIVLLMAALATGGLMVNWAGLARAMAQLSPSTYVELHQSTNRTFNPYMPVVVVGAIVGGVVLAVASGIHTTSGQLSVFGAVCYAAVIAIGVPTDVRINRQVARWSIENPPSDWAAVRARWIRFSRDPYSFFRSGVCSLRGRHHFRNYLKFFPRKNIYHLLKSIGTVKEK